MAAPKPKPAPKPTMTPKPKTRYTQNIGTPAIDDRRPQTKKRGASYLR